MTAGTLHRAKALLLTTSWDPTAEARDASGNRIGSVWPAAAYSLVGAVTHVCQGDDRLACRLVIDVLGSNGLTKPQQLTHWENEPGRTREDVLALLDRAGEK